MKKILVTILFMLAMLGWSAAQQTGANTDQSGGQTASPSSQAPAASQSQPAMPGSADQNPAPNGAHAGSQGAMPNAPVIEGCLGGTDPNYTITDKVGTTYKLNLNPGADTSKLAKHVGESVRVAGNINDAGKAGAASIDVRSIGIGTSTCPGAAATGTPSTPQR